MIARRYPIACASNKLRLGFLPARTTFNLHWSPDTPRSTCDPTGSSGPAPLEGVRSLTVAPSRPLLAIPFALLLTGKADPDAPGQAPWQVRRLAVARVPAPANFTSPRKIADRSRASHPWFGFGDFQPIPLKLAEHSVAPFALIGEDTAQPSPRKSTRQSKAGSRLRGMTALADAGIGRRCRRHGFGIRANLLITAPVHHIMTVTDRL